MPLIYENVLKNSKNTLKTLKTPKMPKMQNEILCTHWPIHETDLLQDEHCIASLNINANCIEISALVITFFV